MSKPTFHNRPRGYRGGSKGRSRGRGRGNNPVHNRNSGKKFCKFHPTANNHSTHECKSGNNSSNNNRPTFGKNTNHNSKVSKKQHGHQKARRCGKCGRKGHTPDKCYAKELPVDERCSCGSRYHTIEQCPTSGLLLEVEMDGGLLCIWCKAEGDGQHIYGNCEEVKKFRTNAMQMILKSYDGLQWCWHCSARDHFTKACQNGGRRDSDRVSWWKAIEDVIEGWIQWDESYIEQSPIQPGQDGDYPSEAAFEQKHSPPMLVQWCIYCQEFGHWAHSNCDKSEYQRRRPSELRGQNKNAPVGKQPFVPKRQAKHNRRSKDEDSPEQADDSIRWPCSKCKALIDFPVECPTMGASTCCSNCRTSNPHPDFRPRRRSSFSSTEAKILAAFRKMNPLTPKTPKPVFRNNAEEAMLLRRRPSNELQNLYYSLPDEQPTYYDVTRKVFNKDHIFNHKGNHQTYFPSWRLINRPEQLNYRNDPDLPINRAGPCGQVPCCQTCTAQGRVIDDERDVVMCGTDVANVMGMGKGI